MSFICDSFRLFNIIGHNFRRNKYQICSNPDKRYYNTKFEKKIGLSYVIFIDNAISNVQF